MGGVIRSSTLDWRGALARVVLLPSSKTENALILESETALAPKLIWARTQFGRAAPSYALRPAASRRKVPSISFSEELGAGNEFTFGDGACGTLTD